MVNQNCKLPSDRESDTCPRSPASNIEAYQDIGDPELDHVLNLCAQEHHPAASRLDDFIETSRAAYEQARYTKEPLSAAKVGLADFYLHYHDQTPEWVDWDQLQRGMDLFIAHGMLFQVVLYYGCLIPLFAIPGITHVLSKTHYLVPPTSIPKATERVIDTTGFTTSLISARDPSLPTAAALRPGGIGWKTALRVRALHAKARRRLVPCKDWNEEHSGSPVNQEEMAYSVLSFATIALDGLERFVVLGSISKQDKLDYLALWRYVGWLLGVQTVESNDWRSSNGIPPLDPCGPDPTNPLVGPIEHSSNVTRSIREHLEYPDEASIDAVQHFMHIGWSPVGGVYPASDKSFSYFFHSLQCRYFCHRRNLADVLKLPGDQLYNQPLTFYAAWIVTLVTRMCLMAGTWLVLHSLWARQIFFVLHKWALIAFQTTWKHKNHGKRNATSTSSACPFAMLNKKPDTSLPRRKSSSLSAGLSGLRSSLALRRSLPHDYQIS